LCDHLRTEISTPDSKGNSIKKCKDCPYSETITAGFFAVEDAIRVGTIVKRTRTKEDYPKETWRTDPII
jgi:hypothetical protein